MQSKIFASIIISLVLMTSVWAIEPPGWVNLGELAETQVRDILEIPATNILVACGFCDWSFHHDGHICRSTDGGQNWTTVLEAGNYFAQLDRDSVSGRIWAVRASSGANTLYYSADTGRTWTGVTGPSSNPAVTGNTIEIVGNFVYFGGIIGAPYDIALYRLNQTTLQWEAVAAYYQCDAITRLKYHNNKLIVFARDRTQNRVRVFAHDPSELDKIAEPIGKAQNSETKIGK
jgi:hypothetical protein